ncbi:MULTISPECIES: hypothetical protein [unclassified Streptomyces]|uniref:IrrE N-terminal-like domain-containing protein n=1 Tax=Streptomyces sp. F12 TaxID=1436084 RepID=V9Z4L6_9ACTN|nr:hypothetical protein [Streptomyces sp. F12]AHE40405.1 Hypothetical protein pFRL6_318c [Streptomyces sp. F12]
MWHSRRARRPIDEAEEVERRSRAFVEELDLPPVDNVLDLVPFMEQKLGREIRLMPFTPDLSDPDSLDASAPCGMWMATETTDYLFYDEGVSPTYTQIIAGHEFAHMLKHRDKKESLGVDGLGGLITDIDPATVRLVLGRTRFDEPDEFEAEMIGSLLREHAMTSRATAARSARARDPIARTLLR